MSQIPTSQGGKGERPYGDDPIGFLAFYATYNLFFTVLYYNLEVLPAAAGRHVAIDRRIYLAAWLIMVAMQYAVVYGLWKPKRWARKLGIASLGLGTATSVVMLVVPRLLPTIEPSILDDLPILVNGSALYAGWRFFNRREVREYIESEGRVKTVPFRLVGREMPERVRGKTPESMAWIAEAKSLGQIYLNENNLIIVKAPSGQVIDISMKDVIKLERGETQLPQYGWKRLYVTDETRVLHAMGLSTLAETKLSKLRITYLTESAQTSTVTLVAERKICPKCGGRMRLVAAGWYCMEDDHLIDPTTNDLVQIIDSKRFAEDI